MSKAKPLTAEQCEAAREAMLTGHSLSKISRCAGVVATIPTHGTPAGAMCGGRMGRC